MLRTRGGWVKPANTETLRPGGKTTPEALRDYTRTKLAAYKVPKQLIAVGEVERAPNGKADYKWARQILEAEASGG